MLTTSAMESVELVAPPATVRLRPDLEIAETFDAGQFVGSLEVIVPGVIEVKVTPNGLVFVKVK